MGKTDLQLFPRELAEQYFADEREVMRTGRPLLNREERVIDGQGGERWMLTSKVPLRDSQGQVIGLVGISRDITERKRAEATLHRVRLHSRKAVRSYRRSLVVLLKRWRTSAPRLPVSYMMRRASPSQR